MARILQQTDLLSLRVWTAVTIPNLQACVTTFDYRINFGGFVAGMTDLQLVTALDNIAAPLFKAAIMETATYHGSQLFYLFPKTPRPLTQFDGSNNGPSTNAGLGLPSQARGLMRRGTNYAGPKYRGRIFFPFPSTTALTVSGAQAAAYQTLISDICVDLAPVAGLTVTVTGFTVVLTPVLFNRATGTTTDIVIYTVQPGFATQKKSGYYGKLNASPI